MSLPAHMDPAPGWLAAGERIYAIGDIHGCADRLRALLGRIAEDLAAAPIARPRLVYLGDYIDRGPDSATVLDLVLADRPGRLPRTHLLGNHEAMLLAALAGDRAAATDWRLAGGKASLQSWGIDAEAPPEQWIRGIPAAHLALLGQLAPSHRTGGYIFVHAGIRPGVAIADQKREDLTSIRHAFLNSDADFGVIVVHGHTPQPQPVIRSNRIGIDTAAVFGGKLTCLVLEGEGMAFLQT
jgi:serine/threonine protein phosphatase 1